jgi:hypothetical protein
MKILSIDVGIKNLAFCLFEKPDGDNEYKIAKWDVVNLGSESDAKCGETEKFKDCNKPAKFSKNGKSIIQQKANKFLSSLSFLISGRSLPYFSIASLYEILGNGIS